MRKRAAFPRRQNGKTPLILRSAGFLNLAERVRFELTVRLNVHWISSPAHSTTLPPFHLLQPLRYLLLASLRSSLGGSMLSEEKDYRRLGIDFQPLFVSRLQHSESVR